MGDAEKSAIQVYYSQPFLWSEWKLLVLIHMPFLQSLLFSVWNKFKITAVISLLKSVKFKYRYCGGKNLRQEVLEELCIAVTRKDR